MFEITVFAVSNLPTEMICGMTPFWDDDMDVSTMVMYCIVLNVIWFYLYHFCGICGMRSSFAHFPFSLLTAHLLDYSNML